MYKYAFGSNKFYIYIDNLKNPAIMCTEEDCNRPVSHDGNYIQSALSGIMYRLEGFSMTRRRKQQLLSLLVILLLVVLLAWALVAKAESLLLLMVLTILLHIAVCGALLYFLYFRPASGASQATGKKKTDRNSSAWELPGKIVT